VRDLQRALERVLAKSGLEFGVWGLALGLPLHA